jgi:DNA-binding beta-propeller fold protein YncE
MKTLSPLAGRLFLLCAVVPLLSAAAEVPLKSHPPIEIPDSRGGFGRLQVDDDKRRLLLSHMGNGTLDVIDLKTEKVLKQIKTGTAMSVAADATKNRYYVTTSREKKLVFIDREKLEVSGEIALPGPAGALAVGPAGVQRIFVGQEEGPAVWVIDPEARKVVTTLTIPSGPGGLLAEDDTSRIYVSVTSDDSLQVVSAADNNSTIGGSWPTAPAKKPRAIVLDSRGEHRLFIAGVNGKLAVLRAGDCQPIGSANIVTGVEQIAFDAALDRLYCPSSSGKMTVLDTRNQSVRELGTVETTRGAKSIAVDPKTHAVWLAYTENGKSYARKFWPQ